jgi:CheY-like chemotaxis protein
MREHPISVLVVDDLSDVADTAATILELNGIRSTAVYCAKDAIAVEPPPDIVFLDLLMPETNGWELAHSLRQRMESHGKRPLLIAVTGCQAEDDFRRSEEAGIDMHLVKPVDPEVMVGIVKRFADLVE